MRPSPQELVDGVRRILKEVVEPELTSDHARQRLAETRAVLAQLDWDNAGLLLAQRTAALREVLADLQEAGLPVPPAVLVEPLGTSYQVLSRQHGACGTALIALLPALDEAAATDPRLAEVRAALLATLLQEPAR